MQYLQRVPVPTMVHRAVLIISVGQEKVQTLSGDEVLAKVRELARSLRGGDLRGVREVRALWLTGWRDFRKTAAQAPWTPYGVLVTVEASEEAVLAESIQRVWDVASKVDQEMMHFTPVDDW